MRYVRILVVVIGLSIIGAVIIRHLKPSIEPQVQPETSIFETLSLEGISHDPQDPSKSVAVINSSFVHTGETFEGYQLVEILANSVLVRDEKHGETRALRITGSSPATKIPTGDAVKPEIKDVSRAAAEPDTSLPYVNQSLLGARDDEQVEEPQSESILPQGFNPNMMIAQAREAAALADLRNLHVAGNAYYYDMGFPGEPVTMEDLAAQGMISTALHDGERAGYRYMLRQGLDGIVVNADPVSPTSGLRHFFIDETGTVFVEQNRQANGQSPEYHPTLPAL